MLTVAVSNELLFELHTSLQRLSHPVPVLRSCLQGSRSDADHSQQQQQQQANKEKWKKRDICKPRLSRKNV